MKMSNFFTKIATYSDWALRAGYPGGLARKFKQGGAFSKSVGQKNLKWKSNKLSK